MPYDVPGLQAQPATVPTHTQGAYADFYLLGSTLLQDYPNLLQTYFKAGGQPVPFLNKIKAMGFSKGNFKASDSPTTGHYEKPRPKHTFGISAIIGSAAGPPKTITVAILASDMRTYTDTFGNVHRWSRPRATENWQFGDGNAYRIISKDETQNPHQLTISAKLSTVDPTVAIVVGATSFYLYPEKGEGTKQIKPLKLERYKYTNTFSILDETEIVSGSNQTTKVFFKPVPGKENLLYLEGIEDAEIRHEQAKSNFFLWAQTSDQLTDFSTILNETVPLKGSEGLIPFIKASGKTINFTDTDSYDIDDIFAVSNYFYDLAIGTENIILLKGRNLMNRTALLFKQFLDNTRVSYTVTDGYMKEGMREANIISKANGRGEFTPEAMFVALEFNGYRIGNYNFIESALQEFNDIYGAGALGYKDVQLALPLGFFTDENKDRTAYLGMEWRGVDNYSRENEVWASSGAGRISTMGGFTKALEDDATALYMRSEIAPHFALGIQTVLQKPTNTTI